MKLDIRIQGRVSFCKDLVDKGAVCTLEWDGAEEPEGGEFAEGDYDPVEPIEVFAFPEQDVKPGAVLLSSARGTGCSIEVRIDELQAALAALKATDGVR